ncbi:unnamed protein product [Acanthoscelides obtectus]|uniref:Malate dehydrogenase, mitochondrial n=1 Tax=Acanthoscelides obtectus TaxID=200917 RepID=A0A9P0PNC1_ACAOB|nr:unnamed protein product [Acanthoscelides obtectus]CAK1673297.1 Probable malate dehydrogenase, mitochondrial [Acanthoscelides obtectus]
MFPISFAPKLIRSCTILLNISKTYCCPPTPKPPVVTVLNACSKIGKYVALLLKQNPLIGELRLYDKNGTVCAVAEDLSHIDTRTKVRSFGGSAVLKHAVAEVDIVVSVGGCKESSRESYKKLFEKNVDDVRSEALHMIEFNPKAVFCIAKPPIEALVPMVSEEFRKAGVYDSRKIIGITSVGSMRANYHIANVTGQRAADVICPIVGGLSTNCLVAVLSQTKPKTTSPQIIPTVQKLIGESEDDVLKLYADCHTVCLSPALAVARFVNTMLKALRGDTNCVDCAFVAQTGHIGQFLPYMTSIVRLGVKRNTTRS